MMLRNSSFVLKHHKISHKTSYSVVNTHIRSRSGLPRIRFSPTSSYSGSDTTRVRRRISRNYVHQGIVGVQAPPALWDSSCGSVSLPRSRPRSRPRGPVLSPRSFSTLHHGVNLLERRLTVLLRVDRLGHRFHPLDLALRHVREDEKSLRQNCIVRRCQSTSG